MTMLALVLFCQAQPAKPPGLEVEVRELKAKMLVIEAKLDRALTEAHKERHVPPLKQVAPSTLSKAQIEAAKKDWDKYPTYHWEEGSGATMVWRNGRLVPSKPPTHISWPGQPKRPIQYGRTW